MDLGMAQIDPKSSQCLFAYQIPMSCEGSTCCHRKAGSRAERGRDKAFVVTWGSHLGMRYWDVLDLVIRLGATMGWKGNWRNWSTWSVAAPHLWVGGGALARLKHQQTQKIERSLRSFRSFRLLQRWLIVRRLWLVSTRRWYFSNSCAAPLTFPLKVLSDVFCCLGARDFS